VWEGHHHSSLMLCGAAVVCLCESEPAPWCRREAQAVLQSPMVVKEVIHVLANRSWWGSQEGEGGGRATAHRREEERGSG